MNFVLIPPLKHAHTGRVKGQNNKNQ